MEKSTKLPAKGLKSNKFWELPPTRYLQLIFGCLFLAIAFSVPTKSVKAQHIIYEEWGGASAPNPILLIFGTISELAPYSDDIITFDIGKMIGDFGESPDQYIELYYTLGNTPPLPYNTDGSFVLDDSGNIVTTSSLDLGIGVPIADINGETQFFPDTICEIGIDNAISTQLRFPVAGFSQLFDLLDQFPGQYDDVVVWGELASSEAVDGECTGGPFSVSDAMVYIGEFPDEPAETSLLKVDGQGVGNGFTTGGLLNQLDIICYSQAGADSNICEQALEVGDQAKVAAVASPGSEFKGWADIDGDGQPDGCTDVLWNVCSITMGDNDVTVKPIFNTTSIFTLTMQGPGYGYVKANPDSNSAIACMREYDEETGLDEVSGTCVDEIGDTEVFHLTAEASVGSSFVGWLNCPTPSENVCSVTVSEDLTVTAIFAKDDGKYVVVDGKGTGEGVVNHIALGIECTMNAGVDTGDCIGGTQDADAPTSHLLIAQEIDGSTFVGWEGDCSATVFTICSVELTDTVKTVYPIFDLNGGPSNASLVAGGSGTGAGSITGNMPFKSGSTSGVIDCDYSQSLSTNDCFEAVDSEDIIVLTATAKNGSLFKGWHWCDEEGEGENANICTQTITGGEKVYAVFEVDTSIAAKAAADKAGIEIGSFLVSNSKKLSSKQTNSVKRRAVKLQRKQSKYNRAKANKLVAYGKVLSENTLFDVNLSKSGALSFGASSGQLLGDYNNSRLDFWGTGSIEDITTGAAGSVDAGVDFDLSKNALIGFSASYSWDKQAHQTSFGNADASFATKGAMLSFYTAMKRNGLSFDASASWGQTSNTITTTSTDKFDSEQLLLAGSVKGNHKFSNGMTVSPVLSASYALQKQASYTNSQGYHIPGQEVAETNVSFGPRVGYSTKLASGSTFSPFAAVKGVYRHESSSFTNTSEMALSARFEGGLNYQLTSGASLMLSGQYDAISSSLTPNHNASLQFSVPLN